MKRTGPSLIGICVRVVIALLLLGFIYIEFVVVERYSRNNAIIVTVVCSLGLIIWMYRPFRKSAVDGLKKCSRFLTPFDLVLAATVCLIYFVFVSFGELPHNPPTLAFQGDSSKATSTQVVPTLTTPIEPDKNVIWCASFQAAWDALRNEKLNGDPVELAAAQEEADRLNNGELGSNVLPVDSYAAAGCVDDGIIERIYTETRERFPDETFELTDPATYPADAELVAYAFLRAYVPFKKKYVKLKEGMTFTAPGGASKDVGTFGIRPGGHRKFEQLRAQVRVLYSEESANPGEYVLDISRGNDTQILLARVVKAETLAATWQYVMELTARPLHEPSFCEFTERDVLKIPEMNWKLDHRFRELEGRDKILLNDIDCGDYLAEARQITSFTLDSYGARLKSEARVRFDSMLETHAGRNFTFDGPFLLALQRRDAEMPYFVMWVDNPELLSPV